ncbi:hypothetical protein L5515_015306 [Caenorhabditis briggsae]|uniref:BTB domain-containing protein n=1 Tax=Caenorhabditis briggsae TaxID=6238 RepID=A0AAE9J949_CAEBR|nr:hypothetical protein L5515_015306 [Caenorhabditis briggsae]
MTEKEFTLKYEFEDVGKLEEYEELSSPEEDHFCVKWKIGLQKCGGLLYSDFYTNTSRSQKIHVDYTTKIFSKNKEKTHSESGSEVFEGVRYTGYWCTSIDWETLKNEYLDEGKLEIEIHVKINKMIGYRKDMRSFGEEIKQLSDVILKVEERKFYVSKVSLSSNSPYFATLFMGQAQESEKSEIELKDVNPYYLQYYLELIYGEDALDEDTVGGILNVADMYNTLLAIKKCEEYLMEKSKMELRNKLKLAGKYRLEKLKKMCLDQIKTKEDIRSIVPKNTREMNLDILAELLDKSLALI